MWHVNADEIVISLRKLERHGRRDGSRGHGAGRRAARNRDTLNDVPDGEGRVRHDDVEIDVPLELVREREQMALDPAHVREVIFADLDDSHRVLFTSSGPLLGRS